MNNQLPKGEMPGPKQPPRLHGEGCICGDSPRFGCPSAMGKDAATITQAQDGNDAERFVKLVRLMNLNCDDKLTVGFINAEVDCRTLNDWRQYLDSVDRSYAI